MLCPLSSSLYLSRDSQQAHRAGSQQMGDLYNSHLAWMSTWNMPAAFAHRARGFARLFGGFIFGQNNDNMPNVLSQLAMSNNPIVKYVPNSHQVGTKSKIWSQYLAGPPASFGVLIKDVKVVTKTSWEGCNDLDPSLTQGGPYWAKYFDISTNLGNTNKFKMKS